MQLTQHKHHNRMENQKQQTPNRKHFSLQLPLMARCVEYAMVLLAKSEHPIHSSQINVLQVLFQANARLAHLWSAQISDKDLYRKKSNGFSPNQKTIINISFLKFMAIDLFSCLTVYKRCWLFHSSFMSICIVMTTILGQLGNQTNQIEKKNK